MSILETQLLINSVRFKRNNIIKTMINRPPPDLVPPSRENERKIQFRHPGFSENKNILYKNQIH